MYGVYGLFLFDSGVTSDSLHVLFQGTKLDLQSRISSHSIEVGDFIVLVPFTKKDRLHDQHQSATTPDLPDQRLPSEYADLAWSDMMQDLSALNDENQTRFRSANSGGRNEVMKKTSGTSPSKKKEKRRLDDSKQGGHIDEYITALLESDSKNIFDEENYKKLVDVLETVCCLSDPHYGDCFIAEIFLGENECDSYREKSRTCICPLWLKNIMKGFAFLNMFSAFLQLHQEKITWSLLKQAVNWLGDSGLHIGVIDLENVITLCPKVTGDIS